MHEKVRRVMAITGVLNTGRILDLACGGGLYALTACRMFPDVSAVCVDARWHRMEKGQIEAVRDGLDVTFIQDDVRNVNIRSYGRYDLIYFLGILYHLDYPDSFNVVINLSEISDRLIIDTHISLNPDTEKGRYSGSMYREHPDGITNGQKFDRVTTSVGNDWSFWYSKPSLLQMLEDAGYSTVFECHVPFEPNKPKDRITLVAMK